MHTHHWGASTVAVNLGTTTIGFYQGETLLTIMPTFSKGSKSFHVHATCFKENV